MTRRYYHLELPEAGGMIQLAADEALHATRVMRVELGDRITLFDGRGNEAEAEIVSVNRRECHCRSEPSIVINRESSIQLHLGIALPKPDRAKELIERLTELGVASVTPIAGARTQRPPTLSLIEKLRRAVIEASKQCGRNQLLLVNEPDSLADFISVSDEMATRWIAHPTGKPVTAPAKQPNQRLFALVGPEGGWTDEEIDLSVASGFEIVNFGKRTLRIETAAVVIASITMD
jgi:16S rRNA (uracil1498-N3)-methyltransferase